MRVTIVDFPLNKYASDGSGYYFEFGRAIITESENKRIWELWNGVGKGKRDRNRVGVVLFRAHVHLFPGKNTRE